MTDKKRSDEFVPVPETEGKPFQVDKYGNHRIVMNGKEGVWHKPYELSTLEVDNKNGTTDVFFAVTGLYTESLPTESVLNVTIVDEDGDSDFYQFKILDIVNDKSLDADGVFDVLQESTFIQGYDFRVKESKHADFVKIKVVKLGVGCRSVDKVLDIYGVIDYLVNTLDRYEFDIYDTDHRLIND